MAAPVIDSVVPSSLHLNPGQFADVVITAHDPDSKTGDITFAVRDSQGNTSNVKQNLVIEDPLEFILYNIASALDGVTVQRIEETATTSTWRVTAPA